MRFEWNHLARSHSPSKDAHLSTGYGDAAIQRTVGRPTIPGFFCMEKILAPTLSPGDVVVLDNLGSHLQPDLNPIEQTFARLKHRLGKTQPLDVEATWRKVGQLIDLFSPAKCANSLVNSSFGSI
jgi:hypothetical protein